ncbi:hypothetical protein Tco_0044329 [Tanacetum coccineum]
METIHIQFNELTEHMAPMHISTGPELILMTHRQISSWLVSNPVPADPYVPPALAVQVPIVSASTPCSITIDQDAPLVLLYINAAKYTRVCPIVNALADRLLGAYDLGVSTPRALIHAGDKTIGDARSWYMISEDAKSWVMSTPAYVDSETITYADGAQSSRVPVSLPYLWHIILNGDFPPVARNKETQVLEMVPFEQQDDDLKKKLAKNNEAKMVLYNALPKKEYERLLYV